MCASCFAVGLKKAEEGAEKDCCAFKRFVAMFLKFLPALFPPIAH